MEYEFILNGYVLPTTHLETGDDFIMRNITSVWKNIM